MRSTSNIASNIMYGTRTRAIHSTVAEIWINRSFGDTRHHNMLTTSSASRPLQQKEPSSSLSDTPQQSILSPHNTNTLSQLKPLDLVLTRNPFSIFAGGNSNDCSQRLSYAFHLLASLQSKTTKLDQSSRAVSEIPIALPDDYTPEPFILEDFSMDRVGLSPNMPLRNVDTFTSPREFTPFQQFARAAPAVTLSAYAINQEPLDNAVKM